MFSEVMKGCAGLASELTDSRSDVTVSAQTEAATHRAGLSQVQNTWHLGREKKNPLHLLFSKCCLQTAKFSLF